MNEIAEVNVVLLSRRHSPIWRCITNYIFRRCTVTIKDELVRVGFEEFLHNFTGSKRLNNNWTCANRERNSIKIGICCKITSQPIISISYALMVAYIMDNNYNFQSSQLVRPLNKVVRIINNVHLHNHITPYYLSRGPIKLPDYINYTSAEYRSITKCCSLITLVHRSELVKEDFFPQKLIDAITEMAFLYQEEKR